jgi:hypothetical protein
VSEPENFLSRWARLKREAVEAGEAAATPDVAAPDAAADAPRPAEPADDASAAPATAPGFDMSTLPPIESITAATDIRAFLAPGVPPDLARAALRRAWVADPKIRDFVGIAENQWDFTAPDAIPGFGPLGPLDDVRRLVARVLGEEPGSSEASTIADAENSPDMAAGGESISPVSSESSATADKVAVVADEHPGLAAPPAADVQRSEATSAAHKDDLDGVAADAPARRTHGGALPK